MITDRNGALVWHYEYFAFGKEKYSNAACSFSPSNRYTGQILDDDTGLYYYNARYYDPELGRFIQPDTIVPSAGDPQSLNRYSYVRNNPLMYVDPTGHYVTPGLALRHSLESGETSPDVPVSEAPPSQSNSSSSKDALEFAQKLDGFVRMGLPVSPFQRSGNVGGSQVIIALHAPDHQEGGGGDFGPSAVPEPLPSGEATSGPRGGGGRSGSSLGEAVENARTRAAQAEGAVGEGAKAQIGDMKAAIRGRPVEGQASGEIYRSGGKNPAALTPRPGIDDGLSARDGLHNPYPRSGNVPLPAGKPIQVIDIYRSYRRILLDLTAEGTLR